MSPRLFRMLRSRSSSTPVLLLAAVVIATSCDRPREQPPSDTATVEPPPVAVDTVVPQPPTTTWDPAAGPALFVHSTGADPAATIIVPPGASADPPTDTTFDGSALRNLAVEMFTRAGRVGQGRLAAVAERSDTAACVIWPVGTIADPPPSWSIGFQEGRARALPIDSIESLAGQDSARLAADLTRLASALPYDTAAALRGIPFGVKRAYRLVAAPGDTIIVADIVRKLTIEASPLEEHILLIAERDSTRTRRTASYFERTSGSEESVETKDLLAAVELGSARRPTLILERSGDAARAFSVLERVSPRRWRVRWTSVYTSC